MRAPRVNDLNVMNLSTTSTSLGTAQCFISRASEREFILWHRRMGHISLRKMNHLVHRNLVEGVNLRNFQLTEECLDCKKGKQTKKPHPKKLLNSINLPFEHLHMDLFGPANVKSVTGELYCLVVTDDYSRFSWVIFLESKNETYDSLMVLFKKLETLYNMPIRRIISDNGTEFKNNKMLEYYSKLPVNFWAEVVAAACYTLNRVLTVKKFGKTCFELLNRRKPNLKWLEQFGSICTVLEPTGNLVLNPLKDSLWGMLVHLDMFTFLASTRSYKFKTLTVNDTLLLYKDQEIQVQGCSRNSPILNDNDDTYEEIIEAISLSISHTEENLQSEVSVPLEVVPRTVSYHPEENIIGDLNAGVEPKTYKEALTEESWVNAMQEELMQLEKLGVWKLMGKKTNITDPKHNICAYLNEEDPKASKFKVIMPFLKRSRIFKGITHLADPYESIFTDFWTAKVFV
ncbi:uncharacterized protein LOC143573978 [Bidens hawaiensis]|uniref:uncharacterized protein LOC143573978 n=1 Tax=Bidens hawaiensis TaxID=980011 RepID=UPI00404B6C5B